MKRLSFDDVIPTFCVEKYASNHCGLFPACEDCNLIPIDVEFAKPLQEQQVLAEEEIYL